VLVWVCIGAIKTSIVFARNLLGLDRQLLGQFHFRFEGASVRSRPRACLLATFSGWINSCSGNVIFGSGLVFVRSVFGLVFIRSGFGLGVFVRSVFGLSLLFVRFSGLALFRSAFGLGVFSFGFRAWSVFRSVFGPWCFFVRVSGLVFCC
jgi:hypothetical protein